MPAFDKPLPANYTIQTLALWLDAIDIGDHVGMARRVRALLEHVAKQTAIAADYSGPGCPVTIDGVVAGVLGRP